MKKSTILLGIFVLISGGMAFSKPGSQPAASTPTPIPVLDPLPDADEFSTAADRQSYLKNTLSPALESAAILTYAPGWIQLNIDTYSTAAVDTPNNGTLSGMPVSHQSHWYLLGDDRLIQQHHQTLTTAYGMVVQQMASVGANWKDLISGQTQTMDDLSAQQVATESTDLIRRLARQADRLQVFGSYEAAQPLVVLLVDNQPTSQTHASADQVRWTIDPSSGLIIQIESFDCTTRAYCDLYEVEMRTIGRADQPPPSILEDLDSIQPPE
jgi:hypothetical protein